MKETSQIMSAFTKIRTGIAAYGTLGALALSLGVNVYLGLLVARPQGAPRAHSVPVGARFPALTVHDLAGKEIKVSWPSAENKLTVIYLFSPTCIWCQRNIENFKAMGTATRSEYRLVPISLTSAGLAKYVERYGLVFPVFADPVVADGGAFAYDGTPETFVVSRDGTVKRVWRGAFTEAVKGEVEAYLGLHLPGMIS
jgi:peroxiredoxin